MAKTVGETVNMGLRTIGEPAITEFTTDNELQMELISAIDEAVHEILELTRYRWGLHQDAFTTKAVLTDGTVSVTNASADVESMDDDGVDDDNFTDVAAGDWLRITGDYTSYEVSSVDTSGTPDTLEIADAYLGTTDADAPYRIFADTYSVSVSNLDEIILATFGEGTIGSNFLKVVDIAEIERLSGGDRHRDTSGKPRYIARISHDASEYPRFVLWPYPDEAYLISYWYTLNYSVSSTDFDTNVFGGDAPLIAYDAVAARVRWRACIYDNDWQQAGAWGEEFDVLKDRVMAKESKQYAADNAMSVQSYRRRRAPFGLIGISQIEFDREG